MQRWRNASTTTSTGADHYGSRFREPASPATFRSDSSAIHSLQAFAIRWGHMRHVSSLAPAACLAALLVTTLPAAAQTGSGAASANATRVIPIQPSQSDPEPRAGAYAVLVDFSRSFVTAQTQ